MNPPELGGIPKAKKTQQNQKTIPLSERKKANCQNTANPFQKAPSLTFDTQNILIKN